MGNTNSRVAQPKEIIYNPGAYVFSQFALRDALIAEHLERRDELEQAAYEHSIENDE